MDSEPRRGCLARRAEGTGEVARRLPVGGAGGGRGGELAFVDPEEGGLGGGGRGPLGG